MEGGAIGSELKCVVARTRMILFTMMLRSNVEKIKGLELHMGKVYVDDKALISTSIGAGWKYNEEDGMLVWREDWARDDDVEENDVRIAKIIIQVAKNLSKLDQ